MEERWAGCYPGVTPEAEKWSGRLDLNQRPPAPKAGALPGCATPRYPSRQRRRLLEVLKPCQAEFLRGISGKSVKQISLYKTEGVTWFCSQKSKYQHLMKGAYT